MKSFLQILFLLSLTTTFALVIPTSVANAQGPTVTEELGDPLATGETVTGEGNETQEWKRKGNGFTAKLEKNAKNGTALQAATALCLSAARGGTCS